MAAIVATVCTACTVGYGLDRPPATAPDTPLGTERAARLVSPPAPAPKARANQVRGQLRAKARWLIYPDGSRFRWRGVTGFMLNEQVSSGRVADATSFLAWANRTGFNVVRVLVMLPRGWFPDRDFTPEKGLAALPETLALARAADMYVEVTVLANTAYLPAKTDLGGFVERAGQICAKATNCALVEVANEIFHGTQRADVHDPAILASWAARVPSAIPTALGAPGREGETLVAVAPVVTIHLDRSGSRWNRVRRVRELAVLSEETERFVIDNEPIGADETERPHERDSLPDTFFAQGAQSRIFEVGSNFHFEDGLRAKVPGPVQQRCAEAFVAGTHIVDDSYMLTFQNAGWPHSPVRSVRLADDVRASRPATDAQSRLAPGSVVAAYAGLTQVLPEGPDPSSVLLLIGVEGDPGIEWRPPWRKTGVVAELPHVRVWSIAQERSGSRAKLPSPERPSPVGVLTRGVAPGER